MSINLTRFSSNFIALVSCNQIARFISSTSCTQLSMRTFHLLKTGQFIYSLQMFLKWLTTGILPAHAWGIAPAQIL